MADSSDIYGDAEELEPSDDASDLTKPGDIFSINCSVAGNVTVQLRSGRPLVFHVEEGQSFMPLAVMRVKVTGTTATATYFNIYEN